MNQPNVSRLFTVEEEPEVVAQAAPAPDNGVAIKMMHIALQAIWREAAMAVANLFTLLSVGTCFVLWLLVPDPKPTQIVALGIYAGFILLANVLVIWSKRK